MDRRNTGALATLAVVGGVMWALGPMSLHPKTAGDDEQGAVVALEGRYQLRYRSSTELRPSAVTSDAAAGVWGGRFVLEGQMEWQPYRPGEHAIDLPEPAATGGARLVMSFPECERLELSMLGNELLTANDCASLSADWTAVVELDRRGHLVKVWEPADTPETTSYLIAHLASELQFTWPNADARDGSTWRGREEDSVGVADSRYTLGRGPDGEWIVARSRDRYHAIDAATGVVGDWTQDVDGRHTVSIDGGGRITRVNGEQSVYVDNESGARYSSAESGLELVRLGEPALVVRGSGAAYAAVMPKQSRDRDAIRTKLLADRVAGLTREQLLGDLAVYANSGTMPDHNRWLWRATGLLKLDPALAGELVGPFMGARSHGRALILDMLVSADTDEAEATLRALLVSDELAADPRHVVLRQRLGFVQDPTQETVEFALDQLAAFDPEDHSDSAMIAAYSAGAIAGRGDGAVADAIHDDLRARLGGVEDPETVTHLLRALANVRDPADTDTFVELAAHDDPGVRMTVADAVGQARSERGHQLLRELVTDASTAVQTQSLLSLREYGLTETDFTVLGDLVSSGGLNATNERLVVQLAVRFRDSAPDASRRLVQNLVGAGIDDNRLLAQANRFLAQVP